MANTFGGLYFDEEVFADYMAEQPTWRNEVIASGIVTESADFAKAIGEKGNVATLPFLQAIDLANYAVNNNDGVNNNTPQAITGSKQSGVMIRRMKAFKAQDFAKEITGADPLAHVAQSIGNYYSQVWEAELMNIMKAVLGVSAVANHVLDLSVTSGSVGAANKVDATTLIDLDQKAFGDSANGNGLYIMHSVVYAAYLKLGLVDFAKYTGLGAIEREITLPTINGKTVIVTDRGTVDATGTNKVFNTYVAGEGAFLSAPKTNEEKPYYTDYDPETNAGIEKLYTKQSRILHPNGFDFDFSAMAADSPTFAELGLTANWGLKFNEKNVRLGVLRSNG